MHELNCAEVYQAENVVVDTCAGTFSVTEPLFLLSKHRRFKACEVNPICVTRTLPQGIHLYAGQVFCKESAIDMDENVCRCAEIYIMTAAELEARKLLDRREVPERLPSMQSFSSRILYHLRTYFGEE